MKNIYTSLFLLSSIFSFSQNSLDSNFFDISKKGDSELKNLKRSNNQLFFSGKEFWSLNFGRYDLETQKFVTYNQQKENYNLNYEGANYATINKDIYYLNKNENGAPEIIHGSENGNIEVFFETPTRISELKQFDKTNFFFASTHYKGQSQTFERLWISDGTIDGTKNIFETDTYSSLELLATIDDVLYFTSGNKTYAFDIKSNQLSEYFSYISNPKFIFNNKIHYFTYNTTGGQDLYVINGPNSSEKVTSFNENFYISQPNYYIHGDNVYLYTDNRDIFYVTSYIYVYNSTNKTIKKIINNPVRRINNMFDYNGEFYFSTDTEDSKSINYKIDENENLIEVNYKTTNNTINNPIVYDNKLFLGGNNQINYYDFATEELKPLNDSYTQIGYYTPFQAPFIYKDELYFVSTDDLNGQELFKYNKTKNKKDIVFNYNTKAGSSPHGFQKIDNNVLFFANDNLLYKFDTKENKYDLVLDENQNQIKSFSFDMIGNINNKKIIFSTNNFELGVSDGTSAGTFVFDKRENNENFLEFYTTNLIPFNNKIIFQGKTKYKGVEPWITDGTKEGTFMLKDIVDGYESSIFDINKKGLLNNKLYFTTNPYNNPSYSNSIYETDGTKDGTKKLHTDASNDIKLIFGSFKDYLIILKKAFNSNSSEYYLFNPISAEKINLEYEHSPSIYFEFENKLYCSEYNSMYYFDENYKKINITNENTIDLVNIAAIDNTMYLYSKSNGFIYTLKNNKLEIFNEKYLNKKEFKIYNENIYFIDTSVEEQYETAYLNIINKNGLKKYSINFNNEIKDFIHIEDFKVIDDVLYLSKNNKLYGQELYTVNLTNGLLGSNDNTQQINIKSNFTVYPNPASDFFKVKSENNHNLSITIFDINGKKIRSFNAKAEEQINIKDLSKGIYIIHLDNGLNKENKKLIIK